MDAFFFSSTVIYSFRQIQLIFLWMIIPLAQFQNLKYIFLILKNDCHPKFFFFFQFCDTGDHHKSIQPNSATGQNSKNPTIFWQPVGTYGSKCDNFHKGSSESGDFVWILFLLFCCQVTKICQIKNSVPVGTVEITEPRPQSWRPNGGRSLIRKRNTCVLLKPLDSNYNTTHHVVAS